MSTAPLAPLAPPVTVIPEGNEWWRQGLHTWHARALQAEAEVASLQVELVAERRRSAESQARLQAVAATR